VIFYAKIASKEGHFSIDDLLCQLCTKLVRRHPHVFGKEEAKSIEEVKHHWERIKKEEGKDSGEKSVLDSIPKTLPSLARGQKILKRMRKSHYPFTPTAAEAKKRSPQQLAEELLALVCEATDAEVELEEAFRSLLKEKENQFRQWEQKLKA
jgi:tetrapyrrole methylase family protein/MazG family protein